MNAIFLVHSLINRKAEALEARLIDSLLLKQPRFQAKIPWIDLVSRQMYRRIDGILQFQIWSTPIAYEELTEGLI